MSTRPRVLVVIGTRPEGIKLAPVVAALARHAPRLETRVALTGQHTDLLDQVLDLFGLPVDWELGIMREGQDLYDIAQGCLEGLRAAVDSTLEGLGIVHARVGATDRVLGAMFRMLERQRRRGR